MKANENEHFMPLNVDEHIDHYDTKDHSVDDAPTQRMMQALQRHYAPRDERQSLEKVWNRLAQSHPSVESPLHDISSKEEREPVTLIPPVSMSTRNEHIAEQRRKGLMHRFTRLVVAALVLFLVGSAVFVFQQAHPGCSAIVSNARHCTTIGSMSGRDTAQIYAQVDTRTSSILYRIDGTTHKVLWHYRFPAIHGVGIEANVIQVVHDVYYLLGTDTDGYYVYALNISNGSLRWRYKVGDTPQIGVTATPLLVDGSVYISQASLSNGYSTLTSLNASTGKLQWQQHYNGTGVADGQKHSTDFATGLVLQAADATTLFTSSFTRKNGKLTLTLAAFDALNGSLRWQKTLNVSEEVMQEQVVGDTLYVASVLSTNTGSVAGGHVRAYDVANGDLKWSLPTNSEPARFIIQNNTMYLQVTSGVNNSESSIYALHTSNGSQLWRFDAHGDVSVPAIGNGVLYMTILRQNMRLLVAIDATTKTMHWSHAITEQFFQDESPMMSDSFIYLSVNGNRIDVFQPSSGVLVSSFVIENAPIVSGGVPNEASLFIAP